MATGHRMKGEKKRTYFHRITIHALKKIVYSNWTPLKKVYKKKKKVTLKSIWKIVCLTTRGIKIKMDVNWYSGMACRRLRGKVMKSCKQIWNCSYYREVVPTRKALSLPLSHSNVKRILTSPTVRATLKPYLRVSQVSQSIHILYFFDAIRNK